VLSNVSQPSFAWFPRAIVSSLQCVAVCCSVLQCVAVLLQCCCSTLQCVAVRCHSCLSLLLLDVLEQLYPRCSMLQCAAACCSVLQCVVVTCVSAFLYLIYSSKCILVAVCCSVLQCGCNIWQCVAVCCCHTCLGLPLLGTIPSSLQCVAACCSMRQCAAVWCSVISRINLVWGGYD